MHQNMNSECIDNCTHCYQTCLQVAMTHCLPMGGKHVEPNHFRMMLDCAAICESSARFQLTGSPYSSEICKVCAQICNACAESCEQLEGMEECVAACRKCAASCEAMAM